MNKKLDPWRIDLEDRRAREALREQVLRRLGNAIEQATYVLDDATKELDETDDLEKTEKLLTIAQLASETIFNIAGAEDYGASRILADFGDRGDEFSKEFLAAKFGNEENDNATKA